MDDGLKQRLVGAIVLVALAVIFLPQLFDQETPYQVVKVPIPQPPTAVVEPAYIEQQRQRVAERQKELVSNKSEENEPQDNTQPIVEEQVPVELITDDRDIVADEKKTAPQLEEKIEPTESVNAQQIIPSLDEQGVPVTWTLQLATFGNQTNADKLLSELRAAGYKAYSKQVSNGQKGLTRVFVGPSLSKDSVIQQQQSIAKRWSLSGLVMRFKP